ncbi:MFS transporter [Yinghuangia sp. ASG 101]|uniref:MFS transporter n=1 Tax=Yinghuangia sp. ASG 101 TaxID=2896848 RepID=UPI001E2D2288|nr:MFS transporter [Yinghuangia sp. ASG 101]UGQ12090.1 MFS transporter [Yinghuangia sp. ASG 101]
MIILYAEAVPLQYGLSSPAAPHVGRTWPNVGANLSWMIIILGLVGGATTPLVSKLADLYGKRRVMLCCSAGFLAGSILCATTDSWTVFLIGRGLQASCFALTAIAVGLIRDLVPRRYMPVALGALATGFGLSGVASPLIGGALTDAYSWRSLFWFLAVYMAALVPLMVIVVPETKLRARQRLDWLGAILIGAGAALVLMYLSNGQAWGWGRPSAWGYLTAGLSLLVVFYLWEKRAPAPIMDPALLRSPKFSVLMGIAFLANMVIAGAGYAMAYMGQTNAGELKEQIIAGAAAQAHLPVDAMQQVITFDGGLQYALGLSLLGYAVRIALGSSVAGMVVGPLGGLWGKRVGLRAPMITGMAALTLSMAMFAAFHASWGAVLTANMVFGVGVGLYFAASNNLVVETVPQESTGIGAGMLAVAGSFGTAVGTAVVTAVVSTHPFRFTTPSPTGQGTAATEVPQVYTDTGWTLAMCVTAGAAALGMITAWLRGRLIWSIGRVSCSRSGLPPTGGRL